MATIKKGPNRFYVEDDFNHVVAQISFFPEGKDKLVIEHTFVPRALTGQGIGQELVNQVCDYARQEHRKVVPVCWFAKKVMTESDEYSDVLETR
jgi:predicted GNAT family acetyltransferase